MYNNNNIYNHLFTSPLLLNEFSLNGLKNLANKIEAKAASRVRRPNGTYDGALAGRYGFGIKAISKTANRDDVKSSRILSKIHKSIADKSNKEYDDLSNKSLLRIAAMTPKEVRERKNELLDNIENHNTLGKMYQNTYNGIRDFSKDKRLKLFSNSQF